MDFNLEGLQKALSDALGKIPAQKAMQGGGNMSQNSAHNELGRAQFWAMMQVYYENYKGPEQQAGEQQHQEQDEKMSLLTMLAMLFKSMMRKEGGQHSPLYEGDTLRDMFLNMMNDPSLPDAGKWCNEDGKLNLDAVNQGLAAFNLDSNWMAAKLVKLGQKMDFIAKAESPAGAGNPLLDKLDVGPEIDQTMQNLKEKGMDFEKAAEGVSKRPDATDYFTKGPGAEGKSVKDEEEAKFNKTRTADQRSNAQPSMEPPPPGGG